MLATAKHLLKKFLRNRKGAALVEYAMLVVGVALVSATAVSVLGNKTADLIAAMAVVLPGSNSADNDSLIAGRLIETTVTNGGTGDITLDVATIAARSGQPRLGINIGLDPAVQQDFGDLVHDTQP